MRKKLLAAGSALLLAAGLITLGATSASAWHTNLSASAVCNTSNGTYTVTYQGTATDSNTQYTVTVADIVPAGSTVTPATQTLKNNANYSFTEVVSGTASRASATAAVDWSGLDHASASASVDLAGTCATATPPQCIPTSTITYTYSQNAENKGTITVTKPSKGNYSDQLCGNGLYVTATSWNYTNKTSWPQTLNATQTLHVTKTGVYDYAAPLTCGQGDIYASFTSQPQPPTQLNGPSNPWKEVFLSSMGLSGSLNPTYFSMPNGCWTPPAPPTPPTATVTVPTATSITACGVYGSVSVPADTTQIHYNWTGNGRTGVNTVTAKAIGNVVLEGYPQGGWVFDLGSYTECVTPSVPTFTNPTCAAVPTPAPAPLKSNTAPVKLSLLGTAALAATSGSFAAVPASITLPKDTDEVHYELTGTVGPGQTVTVTATSKDLTKWTLTGTTSWDFTYATLASLKCITIGDPVVQPPVCAPDGSANVTSGYITIDKQSGVKYQIDGVDVTGIETDVAPGSHTVTALALPGYVLSGSPTEWTLSVPEAPTDCGLNPPTLGLVTPVVTSQNITCKAAGSYTIGEVDGLNQDVTWTVDGKTVPAGTYTVKSAGSVTVSAVPSSTNAGFEDGISIPFTQTLKFTAATDCGDLTTLALPGDGTLASTGADGNTIDLGLLFAGGLLLLGGALVIAEKRFRFGSK